jgi:hypothetical protein
MVAVVVPVPSSSSSSSSLTTTVTLSTIFKLAFVLLASKSNTNNSNHQHEHQHQHRFTTSSTTATTTLLDSLLNRYVTTDKTTTTTQNDLLKIKPSVACGGGGGDDTGSTTNGVFASTNLKPNQLLLQIPLNDCITASKNHDDILETSIFTLVNDFLEPQPLPISPIRRQGIIVATKLLQLRYENQRRQSTSSRSKPPTVSIDDYPTIQHAYVDTLPWDSLQSHPLVLSTTTSTAKNDDNI